MEEKVESRGSRECRDPSAEGSTHKPARGRAVGAPPTTLTTHSSSADLRESGGRQGCKPAHSLWQRVRPHEQHAFLQVPIQCRQL